MTQLRSPRSRQAPWHDLGTAMCRAYQARVRKLATFILLTPLIWWYMPTILYLISGGRSAG